jgi:uncharacterized protein (TIGR00255 family)
MTGFGKGEAVGLNYTITTEIKTVNNRFKDFKFRMSSLFNSMEIDLRSKLETEFKRGSFDISVSYKKNEKSTVDFNVDATKVEAYVNLLKPLFDSKNMLLQVSPVDFLRHEFFSEEDSSREEEIKDLLLQSFSTAITSLKQSRNIEGVKLSTKLLEHLDAYEKYLTQVESIKSLYPEMVRNRLGQKLNEKLQDFKLD